MDVTITKCITIVILLVVTFALGLIPYFIVKRGHGRSSPTRDKVLSFLNCFAGGVFLGTCLLHLFVEGRKDLDTALEGYNMTGYPLFEVFVGSGFFLISAVEKLAFLCLTGSVVMATDRVTKVEARFQNERTPLIGANSKPPITFSKSDVVENGKDETGNGSAFERSLSHAHEMDALANASGIRTVLLLLAMSFHTIFDGLAVGLQKSSRTVWETFVAICVHKCLVSFCLGFQLARNFQNNVKKLVGCFSLFALMSPIGITIGIALMSVQIDLQKRDLSSGILQGIACGTFLYVTCFEILKDELSHREGFGKVAVAILGFGVMAGVKALDMD